MDLGKGQRSVQIVPTKRYPVLVVDEEHNDSL